MFAALLILILFGAVASLVGAVAAVRAWLRFRRAQRALQDTLSEEVGRLSTRTGELEEKLTTLDARAQQLPVQISEIQQNLATLRVLTGALASSLHHTQRMLSFTAIKAASATRISQLLPQTTRNQD